MSVNKDVGSVCADGARAEIWSEGVHRSWVGNGIE